MIPEPDNIDSVVAAWLAVMLGTIGLLVWVCIAQPFDF